MIKNVTLAEIYPTGTVIHSYELKEDHARLGKAGAKFSAWRNGSTLAWVCGEGPIMNYSDIDKLVEEGKALAL